MNTSEQFLTVTLCALDASPEMENFGFHCFII